MIWIWIMKKEYPADARFWEKKHGLAPRAVLTLVVLRMNSGGHWVSLVICMNPT